MEVAGVVIGAVALLIPATRGYQSCMVLLKTYRGHDKDLKKRHEELSVQKRVFDRECLLLLGSLVGKDVAIAMLADRGHTRWSDQALNDRWVKELGGCFNIPLKIIGETLNEIEEQFSSRPYPLQAFQTIRLKLEWALSKKKKIQSLLDILRKQNQGLRWLREQRSPLQELQDQVCDKRNMFIGLGTPGFPIRNAAGRLYNGLSTTAVCSCHRVNLQLQPLESRESLVQGSGGSPQCPSITQTVSFQFVVTKDAETQDIGLETHQCTCLTVDTEFHIDITASSLSETCGVGGGMDLIANLKYVQPDDTTRWPIHGRTPAVNSDTVSATKNTLTTSFSSSSTEPTSNIATIDDLCSHLHNHQLDPGLQKKEFLGVIQNATCTADYRHLIYRRPKPYPMTSRISLSEIFTSRDKQGFFPRDLRLKTAFLLSNSLLQFGSDKDCWFQDRWRAQDIFFFPNHLSRLDSTLLPYIAAFSHKLSKGKGLAIMPAPQDGAASTIPAGLSRNEKIFSLALILIEIAFGDSIFNLGEPTGLCGSTQNEFVEYIKAKGIIDSQLLIREMGASYAAVVKRCFYCDFGIGEEDLGKEEVQDVFYQTVVLELESCLKKFMG